MSDAPTTTPTPEGEGSTTTVETEKTVPYERFDKVNKAAKEAKAQTAELQRQMTELQAQMEERESAGLPELERMKKDMERVQKRADEAEAKAAAADTKLARSQKERWVTAAAKDFADPSDAAAFLNLDDIEDEKDAERAVKRLATQKKHLLKTEEPQLPGRVMQNGQPTSTKNGDSPALAEAQMIADGLKQMLKSRQQ